jgi:hypothetical protein
METKGYNKTYPFETFEAIELNDSMFVFIFHEVKVNIDLSELIKEGTRYFSILDCHAKHEYNVTSFKTSTISTVIKTGDLKTQMSYHKLSEENIFEFIQTCQKRFDFVLEQIMEHFANNVIDQDELEKGLKMMFNYYIHCSIGSLFDNDALDQMIHSMFE